MELLNDMALFVEVVKANPAIATDAECMTTWFASAMMRGYDEARKLDEVPA